MKTLRWLGIGLLLLPILELAVMAHVASLIGFVPMLILLILAGMAGSALLRRQGLSNWMRVRTAFETGALPAQEMMESSLIALGALLLIIPGFISDLLAAVCLIPNTRRYLARRALVAMPDFQKPGRARPAGYGVIEGEFRREQ